jgi:hypothetical protein
MTSFGSIARPPSGRNRHLASFSKWKTAFSVETVRVRRKIPLEHKDEIMVDLTPGDSLLASFHHNCQKHKYNFETVLVRQEMYTERC